MAEQKACQRGEIDKMAGWNQILSIFAPKLFSLRSMY